MSKNYSIPEAASSLGISQSALRKWVSQEKESRIAKFHGSTGKLSLVEHEELQRLRKENARLKMEREILKKAAAFFAQEPR